MARVPNVTCNRCGKAAYRKPPKHGSEYRCHECRRAEPQPTKPPLPGGRKRRNATREAICEGCGQTFRSIRGGTGWTRYCGLDCYNLHGRSRRAVPTEWTIRLRRKRREADTPGLTGTQRRHLLTAWRRTKACAYCDRPADTIDHVVPLSRGGTNHEGNLVPCCKACNSSKADLLLVEWRLGKPHGGTICQRPWMDAEWVTPRREPKPKPDPIEPRPCAVCGTAYQPVSTRHATCSGDCSYEWTKRLARNRYRVKVGLPEDWTTPTRNYRAA